MCNQQSIVQFGHVSDMLDHDPAYLKEFCEAAIISFSTFREEYSEHMSNRDLEDLRKAGHRIKPVAEMLGVESLIEEYEKAKTLLEENKSNDKINNSIQRVNNVCEQVLEEFHEKIDSN